jgi:aldose 1-epimerase
MDIPTGAQWRIEADGHAAVVVEVGGGLRDYAVAGESIVDGYGEGELPAGAAGQLLAPWPNRIRDGQYTFDGVSYQLPLTEPTRYNALHGLVNWVRWEPLESSPSAVTLTCAPPPIPGYPWPLRLRTTWSVSAAGLTATHEATNLGTTTAPFGLGVHPYVRVPGTPVDDVVLHLPARQRLLLDTRMLPIGAARVGGDEYDFTEPRPIGATVLDSAYGGLTPGPDGGSTVTLASPDGARSVTVWADSAFRWWQVFTGDTLSGERKRRSVAVEPMSCPPDALRSGRDVVPLAPGETWTGTWGITPRL